MSLTLSQQQPALLVIGGGNMGKAIVAGAIAARVLTDPGRVMVIEPDTGKHDALGAIGVSVCGAAADGMAWLGAAEGAAGTGIVLLAVKPQSLAAVAGEIRPLMTESRVIISILAGTPAENVGAALGGATRVVRAMPNLPASIGLGITAICLGAGARESDDAFARHLFSGVGEVVQIDEALMDAFTALAGSGPAYLFYLAEAMTSAAGVMGFSPEIARQVVRQTLLGSATLLSKSPEEPGVLRGAVTSKGGTTGAAMSVLDSATARETVIKAIIAARDRGRELGQS